MLQYQGEWWVMKIDADCRVIHSAKKNIDTGNHLIVYHIRAKLFPQIQSIQFSAILTNA